MSSFVIICQQPEDFAMFQNLPWDSTRFREISWGSMGFHKVLWDSMRFCGIPWGSMGFHGVPWGSMRFYDVSVNRSVPTEANRGLTAYSVPYQIVFRCSYIAWSPWLSDRQEVVSQNWINISKLLKTFCVRWLWCLCMSLATPAQLLET
jgi:hypothetical protein